MDTTGIFLFLHQALEEIYFYPLSIFIKIIKVEQEIYLVI